MRSTPDVVHDIMRDADYEPPASTYSMSGSFRYGARRAGEMEQLVRHEEKIHVSKQP